MLEPRQVSGFYFAGLVISQTRRTSTKTTTVTPPIRNVSGVTVAVVRHITRATYTVVYDGGTTFCAVKGAC